MSVEEAIAFVISSLLLPMWHMQLLLVMPWFCN